MRSHTLLALVVLTPACFNPGDNDLLSGTDTDANSNASTGDDGNLDVGTDGTADTDAGTPGTTGSPTAETGGDPVCGDGEVEGDEVCDDGVNDGSYGGCAADCTAQADYCGDGMPNGPEACDNGMNDGAYAGCNADCTLAAFCGDGMPNGPELCDEGEANENGAGCNVDCTTSGAVVGESLQMGLSFCDGSFTTRPQFTPDGMALVSASGYCGDDSQLLQRITPEVEVDETFTPLLPNTPIDRAAMVGDRWLLSAGQCNYTIDPMGDFVEICDNTRVTGRYDLEGAGENYFALDFDEVAAFASPSPVLGDTPTWLVPEPAPGFYTYDWRTLGLGANDSVLIGGGRTNTNDGSLVGYVHLYTGGGNLADTYTYAALSTIDGMATSGDGSVLLYARVPFGAADYPGGNIIKLNVAFGEDWSIALDDPGDVQMAFDSAGDVIMLNEDGNGNQAYSIRKLRGDDGMERWSTPLPQAGDDSRINVAEDDYTWVSSAAWTQLWVGRIAP